MMDLLDELYGLNVSFPVAAVIGAFIIGKAILIADKISFVNLFRETQKINKV